MTPDHEKTGKKRRLLLAVGLSILVTVAAGANAIVAGKNPLAASLQDFGQWLSGVAGALAFIWLIVSYFQQGEELELQRKELAATREQLALQKIEMARLADEAEKQSNALQIDARMVERDIAMKFARLAEGSVTDSVALILGRLRRRHGASASIHTAGGIYVLSLLARDLEGRDVTFLLRELGAADAGQRKAWAQVLASVPEIADDVARITSVVDDFRVVADRAEIASYYDQADFMRLAPILRTAMTTP